MTLDEIEALAAGQELDEMVAEKIMGWKKSDMGPGYPVMWFAPAGGSFDLQCYSTDAAAASQVVEHLRAHDIFIDVYACRDGYQGLHRFHGRGRGAFVVAPQPSETAPLAICLAALRAVMI